LTLYHKDSAMKRLLLPFVALAVFTAALAGCGQKGPLYLPDDQKAKSEHSKDRYGL
jgi:predicted small lipoprotein YifL